MRSINDMLKEELLKNYEKAAQQYRDFRQRMNEMEERYCRKRVKG